MKPLIPILALLFTLGSLQAQSPLLSVDFNAGSKTPSATQSGFLPVNLSVAETKGPLSVTFPVPDKNDEITVTLACGSTENATGNFTARAREIAPFPFQALYADAVSGVGGQYLTLALKGLKPSQSYRLQFYAFSPVRSGTMTFTDVTSGSKADSAEVAWEHDYSFSESTPDDVFSGKLNVTADAQGKVVVSIFNKDSFLLLNGFQVFETN